jgi:hypothetical protein
MKIIFFTLCIFICGLLRSQINIINQSLTDSSLAIFYNGVDNRVKITGSKAQATVKQLVITGNGNALATIGNGEYIIRVLNAGTCTLIYSEHGKKVLEKEFTIEKTPYAVATLNGIWNDSISIDRLLTNPIVKIIFPASYLKPDIRVVSFNANFA